MDLAMVFLTLDCLVNLTLGCLTHFEEVRVLEKIVGLYLRRLLKNES